MSKQKFSDSLRSMKSHELLDLLQKGLSGNNSIDPDQLDAVISELQSRNLDDETARRLDLLISDSSPQEPPVVPGHTESTTSDKKPLVPMSNRTESESGKYTALKTVTGLLSFLGYSVILLGIILLMYMVVQEKNAGMGFLYLVISILIALPLLAFSNLVQVFIDIEYNTRKTHEALSKK